MKSLSILLSIVVTQTTQPCFFVVVHQIFNAITKMVLKQKKDQQAKQSDQSGTIKVKDKTKKRKRFCLIQTNAQPSEYIRIQDSNPERKRSQENVVSWRPPKNQSGGCNFISSMKKCVIYEIRIYVLIVSIVVFEVLVEVTLRPVYTGDFCGDSSCDFGGDF